MLSFFSPLCTCQHVSHWLKLAPDSLAWPYHSDHYDPLSFTDLMAASDSSISTTPIGERSVDIHEYGRNSEMAFQAHQAQAQVVLMIMGSLM